MGIRIFIWKNLKLQMTLNKKLIVPSILQLLTTLGSVLVPRAKKITTVILLLDGKQGAHVGDYQATSKVFQVKMNSLSLIDITGIASLKGDQAN